MLKKVGLIFCLLVLTAFSAQKIFAATPSTNYNKNIFLLTPTPTPTPAKFIFPSGLFHTLAPATATPTSTPSPSATPTPSNTPTASSTTTQNSPTESASPTAQTSPSVSPVPTPTPSQQTLIAGLSKETLIISAIVILIIVIIFLTRWNIIKKWLNRKTKEGN